jgi:aminopeptidase
VRVTDPRVEAYARLLVDRSIAPAPGWQVLVAATTEARPVAEELSRLLGERGAYALARISFGGVYPVDAAWVRAAPELALHPAPLEQHVIDNVDGAIFVLAPEVGADELTPEQRRAYRAQFTAYRARGRAGTIREVRCDFPCEFYARRAGMSIDEFADVFYDACLRDWDDEGQRMLPVKERFDRAREVRVVAPGTDLGLSVEGRHGAVDDGHQNVPGGEVFYSPVEDSAEGVVRFGVPSGTVRNARLVFRGGEVVEAAADAGEELLLQALQTDPGARRLGELGFGCNDAITRPLNNVLFDEKMSGTVHLALGQGFAHLGGTNTSDLHWDLVCDLRSGGRIECDGEVVQEDGNWLL